MQTHREIVRYLDEFLKDQTKLEDTPENRAVLSEQIRKEYDSVFDRANLAGAADDRSDDLTKAAPVPKKQRRAIYSDSQNTKTVLTQVQAEYPWLNIASENNLLIIFDWLQSNDITEFTVATVRAAVQVLGRSALESIQPPVAPAAPVVVAPPKFDWNSISDTQEIPLVSPVDGTPPPIWRLQRATREQMRSYVKRDAEAKKPKPGVLPEGELGLDATQEQMQLASPAQLARLIQRQRQARYGG